MQDFSLKIEKITGQASSNTACGVFSKKITLSSGELGTLVACVLIKNGQEIDAQILLKDIFELSTKKLEDAQGQILQSLESARDACREHILERQTSEPKASEDLQKPQVSFVLLFFYKEACYIARHDQNIKIFVFEPPKSLELTFESGSGPIKSGQIYLISTEKFLSIFDSSVFSKETGELDLEEIIDGLATEISARQDQEEIGAAFVLVKEEEAKETEKAKSLEAQELVEDSTQGELVDEPHKPQEMPPKRKLPKFNPLPFAIQFLGKLVRELKSLKRGEIKAIFRLRRNLAIVAAIVLLVLAASALFTISQKRQNQKFTESNTHLSAASAKYAEAQALLELNKSRAREILIDADREIKLAQELVKSDESQKLAEDIAKTLKETEVTENINFETLAELDGQVNSLSFDSKKLVAFSLGKIFEINPADKSKDEIGGPSDIKSGFVFDGKGFILTNDKVIRVNLLDGRSETIIEGQTGRDIAVFIGNIYLLTPDQVVKFSPIEGGYADGVDYLNEKANFTDSSRMAIDGNVWLTSGQKILKFLRGENKNFEISGLTAPVGEFGIVYTSSSLDNLYVVDSKNSALLVVGKDGVYKKAYQSAEFGRASDVVINNDEDTMYIADGPRILEAKLE